MQTFEETDEFGIPRQTTTRRYGWLGGKERRTELASGVVQMGVRSYIPTMGRFTSVDPVTGGSASAYDYGNADPVNQVDLDGRCVFDGDLNPLLRRKGRYYFWEVCSKRTGRRVGYLKIRADRYEKRPKRNGTTREILRRGAGGAAMVGGVAIQGACMVGTVGLGTVHCLSIAGPLTVGGAILLFGD
jgi:RHS repeat-associated protein